MNETARIAVRRAARRAFAQDAADLRAGWRPTMVNPTSLQDELDSFEGDVDAAWTRFAREQPEIAALQGADQVFSANYR